MNITYYTSGTTGSGRVILGISIGNALKRKKISCDYTILNHSKFAFLAEDYKHIEIPQEPEKLLSIKKYKSSILYSNLKELKPDILIIDHVWFSIYYILKELICIKIYLSTQVDDRFFSIPLKDEKLIFSAEDYDFVFAIEPQESSIKMKQLNPFVIRNRDEILSREAALSKLNLLDNDKNCLFAINGEPDEFKQIKKMYSYLEDDTGYKMFYTTNYQRGIFPAVDYFNAFNLVVCSAGYNAFWEVVYFKKQAIFAPVPRRFENQQLRINYYPDYQFEQNGADQLADIIKGL